MKPQAAGHRRLLTKVTAANWPELKTLCEAGGNEVTLTDDFDASSYDGQIDFSGKTCVVKGQGQTLDAKGAGRFFYGSGAGSSLEVHGLVLMNGSTGYVSNFKAAFSRNFFELSSMSGGGTSNSIGRSNLCGRRCECEDLHVHLREKHRSIRK
jgi:hypothetical protein